jgi:hypothetical protein
MKFIYKIKTSINVLLTLIFLLVITSCEKVIDYEVKDGETQYVIDAFITNDTGVQTIKLSYTQNILNSSNVKPILGATVKVVNRIFIPGVIDTSRTFIFKDVNNNGNYVWKPNPSEIFPFGIPLTQYDLSVVIKGEEFTATSFMDSTVDITNALSDTLLEADSSFGRTLRKGYVLDMKPIRDLAGRPNGYWFKTFRNGKFLNNPSQLNLAYDAAFGPGFDGIFFIAPIISNLTPDTVRFNKGEIVTVEVHSIGLGGISYLNQVQREIQNTGIFSRPPSNISSNIVSKDKNSKKTILGGFVASAVSKQTIVIR